MRRRLAAGAAAMLAISLSVPLYGCGRSNEQIHEEVFDYAQEAGEKASKLSDAMPDVLRLLKDGDFEKVADQVEYIHDLDNEVRAIEGCPKEAEDLKALIEDASGRFVEAADYIEKALMTGDLDLMSSYIELSTSKLEEANDLVLEATEEMDRLDEKYSG